MSGYQQNSSSSVNRVTPIVFTAWCLLSACTPTDIPVKSWTNAFEGIYSAAISHDGTRTFIGSSLHGGSVWNLSENERLYEWNHKQGEFSLITAAAISPDEQYIATVDGDTVVLWEAYSGRALQYFTAPADILSIALAPRGNFALLGLTNHSVVYFDIKNGGVIRTIQFDNSILSLALSDDGQLAIVGLSNSDAKLLDIKRELLLQDWHTKGWVKTVAISSNNRYVFIASQYRKATIRDINTGATISSLKVGTVFFRSFPAFVTATFSPDNNTLITGNSAGVIEQWDVSSGEIIRRWKTPRKHRWKPTNPAIVGLGLDYDANRIFAVSTNGMSHELRFQGGSQRLRNSFRVGVRDFTGREGWG